MDPLLVITNKDAGTADEAALERALAVLREHTSVEVAATGDPGELDGVLHRAGSRRIVVAGGDGSLHAVVAALHRRRDLAGAVLGLLPMGTGNDFARATGVPLDLEEAARLVVTAEPRPVDLVVDEVGEVVVNHVHLGAGALASRTGAGWKERLGSLGVGRVNLGRLAYPMGALAAALDPPYLRLRVEVDGEVVCDLDHEVLMVAVGNGPDVGGGASLTPGAHPADGMVDVMVSRAVGLPARLGYYARILHRSHHTREDVLTVRGREVQVCGDPFWVSADGEIYGPERRRTWRVEAAAYRMLLPALLPVEREQQEEQGG